MQKKLKPKYKILWYTLSVLALIVLSIIVIPPMVQLNFLKQKIENVIMAQTGVPVTINGDINASLLGKATIVAHDLTIPNGTISECEFTIPFFNLFNLKDATISEKITVKGASLTITELTPFDIKEHVIVKDSSFQFLNKTYKIISANLSKQESSAIIRTDQHKYEISSKQNQFVIKNHKRRI